MNKKILTILVICAVIGLVGFGIYKNNSASYVPEPVARKGVTTTFTIDDLKNHATEADCYSAVDGVVYDLTAWIKKHPGGDRNILRICGIDGTEPYNSQHGRDKKARNILTGFEVGTLTN